MAAIDNLVHETSTSTGTGNFTLSAVDGRQSFNDAFGTGGTDAFYYFLSHRTAGEWEVGTGHLSDATTLVRDTVLASSTGSAVSFSAGTKDVTNDVPAADSYFAGGTDVAITDGGTGASTASAAFTNLKQAASDSATGVVELATTAETEARTDTSRAVTASGLATFARVATGSYTGDGTTMQTVTGVGFQPKFIWISPRNTTDNTISTPTFSTDVIEDDNAAGGAVQDGGASWRFRTSRVNSFTSDGFSVDDGGGDSNPNTNGQVYNYLAIG